LTITPEEQLPAEVTGLGCSQRLGWCDSSSDLTADCADEFGPPSHSAAKTFYLSGWLAKLNVMAK
jgi:hypothetical protein